MTIPRGVSNNNPGNLIRTTTDKWQGVSALQTDPRFWNFDEAVYGIRAIARQLISYQDKHGCKTVQDAINRYAPPSDNNPTDIYAENVAHAIGLGFGESVDWHKYEHLRPGLEAIIAQENGAPWRTWYSDAQMIKACVLAGVEPPRRSLVKSGQMIGSAVVATATVAAPVVQTVQEQLAPLTDYSPYIKSAFIAVALIGVIITVLSRINERKKGIS